MTSHTYEFLDCGNGRRLENLGGVLVSRPAPAAAHRPGLSPEKWNQATLSFDKSTGWSGTGPDDWRIEIGGVTLALRLGGGGQVGVFPEHAYVSERLLELMEKRFSKSEELSALNLFAHTGLGTLRVANRPEVLITHVDSSGSAVRMAKRNAELSGLQDARIRWIVEDVMKFCKKEVKREKRYDVIIADPPAFGRGVKGEEWKLERDLGGLLSELKRLLAPGGILCFTCHREGWGRGEIEGIVKRDLSRGAKLESEELSLISSKGGRALRAGVAVYGRV